MTMYPVESTRSSTSESHHSVSKEALLRDLMVENMALKGRLAELQEMAYRDSLTGLFNRRFFERRIAEEESRASRGDGQRFALVVVDVDDFKEINDSYGHGVGDQALQRVARFLERHIRRQDVCCRTGGDEFALLLPESGPQGAEQVVSRLRHASAGEQLVGDRPMRLSIGVAVRSGAPRDINDLVAEADLAMYRDKARRRCV